MARTHIGRLSWGGVIALCAILLLAPETRSQTMKISKRKYQISGTVGLAGVTMQGLPGAPITDDNGVYSAEVEVNWSGTVTPVKLGHTFEPKNRIYQKVTSNLANQDYKGTILSFTISGSTELAGVKLIGLPGEPVSDPTGRYSVTVEFGFSGEATPEKIGYRFEPSSRQYGGVKEDHKNSDYKARPLTFKISGTAGAAGVTMKGLPGNVVTKEDGSYTAEVGWAWKGPVTPTKEGWTFNPPSREYADVIEPQTNQDYTATVFTYKVSGTAGMPGVLLKGLPGEVVTDANGFYTAVVEHGWLGKVTPEKAGYTFSPALREYTKVVANTERQDYNSSEIYLAISGKTGTGNVALEGLPGAVTSDATGVYTVKVPYGWSGSVTPVKEGYSFDPSNPTYDSLSKDVKQDYKAQAITFKISGSTGMAGVILRGLPNSPVSGPDGSYSVEVAYKWSGAVTPTKTGYTFDPPKQEYKEVLEPVSADYTAKVLQYTISGRITGESGPVAEVFVIADNNGGSTTTDAQGEFQLQVDHGWKGKITAEKDGFTFEPRTKPFEAMAQNMTQNFTGKIKMVSITSLIQLQGEPIANVKITAEPGKYTATTDNKGKYSIKVPWGWSGDLVLDHTEFVFDPNKIPFANVIEDIDTTTTKKPTPAVQTPPTRGPGTKPSVGPTPTTKPVADANQTTTAPTPSPQAMQQIDQKQKELTRLQNQVAQLTQQRRQVPMQTTKRIAQLQQELAVLQGKPLDTQLPSDQIPTIPAGTQLPPFGTQPAWQQTQLPPSAAVFGSSSDLVGVLTTLAQRTGANIAIDLTVKRGEPVAVPFDLNTVTLPYVGGALNAMLQGTAYRSRQVGDSTFLVYKPISQTVTGDLRTALTDLSTLTEIPIIPDPNVTGTVNVDIKDQPLETALEIMLAGTGYVVKKTAQFYLVADPGSNGPAFKDISETRQIRVNYNTPERIAALLSPAFTQFVKAEPVDSRDPNNRGHILTITASPAMADRIVDDIRQLDTRPRQVLLEARVVVMERGDLLNLGVQWAFPTLRAGVAYDSSLHNQENVLTNTMTGIQIGYTSGRAFTESLMAALKLLQENSQADIVSSPKLLAQDGRQSQLRQVTEEWFMMTSPTQQQLFYAQSQLEKIESGTVLSITPHIGDNNDITLDLAIEVSDSIPSGRGSQLPVVTRRTAQNSVTVEDGGTVALAGLTENRSRKKEQRVPFMSDIPLVGGLFRNKDNDKSSREIAVFVTAYMIRDAKDVNFRAPEPTEASMRTEPARNEFRQNLAEALSRQNQ